MFTKILLILFIFLSGCQSVPRSNEKTNTEDSRDFAEGEVISVSDHSMLISYNNTLANVSLKNTDGSFNIGNIVKVSYDSIQEVYPLILTNPDIELKETGDNRIETIFNVICELYETDPALNHEINFISIDLSDFNFLNDSQKNALSYLIESKFDTTVYQLTMKELIEEGLAEELLIPEGILFTFKCKDSNSSTLNFSCIKYRSGLGAIFFDDCQAKLNNHKWDYQLGGFAIS